MASMRPFLGGAFDRTAEPSASSDIGSVESRGKRPARPDRTARPGITTPLSLISAEFLNQGN